MASTTSRVWLLALLGFARVAIALPAATDVSPEPLKYVTLPPSVPQKIRVTDKPADPAGKLVKMRYGPFKLPPNSVVSALPEFAGGPKISKPCEECYIGAFQGGLEYEDGSEANVDTGMYLHHFVLVNNNKPDWLCGLRIGSLFRSQYVYNSGNERPPVRLNSKYKFGMRFDKEDTLGAAAELMNMSNETKTVYSTVIYEVIPLDTPGYNEATHLRIDVWQCGGSDVPAKKGAYKYTSPNFTSPYSGHILHTDGHGHDGTTEVKLHINSKVFCNSIQYYGLEHGWTQPHAISKAHGDQHGTAMQYISNAVTCEDHGRLEKGDVVWTEAFYNGTKYPQMEFRGRLQGQMGIHFLYIGRDANSLKDKLRIENRFDELPVEMNMTSAFSGRRPGRAFNPGNNATATNATHPAPPTPAAGSKQPAARPPWTPFDPSTATLATILGRYGITPNTNLSLLFPGMIPPDFNISDPYVVAPFPPFQRKPRPGFFGLLGGGGGGGGSGGPSGGAAASHGGAGGGAGVGAGFNLSNPATQKALQNTLMAMVPGLPKGFKISDLLTTGGIVMSEMDELFGGVGQE